MLEGKTQTTLEWPQSVALAVVVFDKKICNPGKRKKAGKDTDLRYRSLTAGRDERQTITEPDNTPKIEW